MTEIDIPGVNQDPADFLEAWDAMLPFLTGGARQVAINSEIVWWGVKGGITQIDLIAPESLKPIVDLFASHLSAQLQATVRVAFF